ncbi:STAS-like domain-containing protein [Serratia microhaemolytica]|uniref:STAS-like domain-containing protein n=1 Tax=Serratia microhaemolytica TaxID=2675110 RepID=UPI000FDEA664|nr:STAS-like domain-containing protein [Serratia microhaemolytica]
MKKIVYRLPEGDLASRAQGVIQRHKIEAVIRNGDMAHIDLSDVYSVSESYSDEIFGVLVIKFGVDTVLQHVRILNASPSILRSIAKVMQRRNASIVPKASQKCERERIAC